MASKRPAFGGRRYTRNSGKSVAGPAGQATFESWDLDVELATASKGSAFASNDVDEDALPTSSGSFMSDVFPSEADAETHIRRGPASSGWKASKGRPSRISRLPERERDREIAMASPSPTPISPTHRTNGANAKKRAVTLESDRGLDLPDRSTSAMGSCSPVPSPVPDKAPARSNRRLMTVSLGKRTTFQLPEEVEQRGHEGRKRQLSFIDATVEEVWQVIQEVEPFLDWLPEFWARVLTLPTPPCSKSLSLRSLANWVGAYNRWQRMGQWTPGQAPLYMNAFEMQEMLALPMPKVLEFVKLFDPAGYERVNSIKSPQDYAKVKVSVPAFLTTCIMMSASISKKQKMRFLLGVFDENDNRTFEEGEFIAMLQAVFTGMASVFGMLANKDGMPSTQRMECLAKRLFQRISDSSGSLGSESLSFSVIEEWFLGETDDPLNVPFALFMERHSTVSGEDDPELFEDEDRKFRLSHTAPVDPPMETSASLDSSFIGRHETVMARKVFDLCVSLGSFAVTHSDVEKELKLTIDPDFWIGKLHRALDEMDNSRSNGVKTNLTAFFKKLCPRAAARHLRMFHNWLKEYDQLIQLQDTLQLSQKKLRILNQYTSLDPLPAPIRQELVEGWQAYAYAR
ncbi:unnamed protein product, partial [Effrenium voratum]